MILRELDLGVAAVFRGLDFRPQLGLGQIIYVNVGVDTSRNRYRVNLVESYGLN